MARSASIVPRNIAGYRIGLIQLRPRPDPLEQHAIDGTELSDIIKARTQVAVSRDKGRE